MDVRKGGTCLSLAAALVLSAVAAAHADETVLVPGTGEVIVPGQETTVVRTEISPVEVITPAATTVITQPNITTTETTTETTRVTSDAPTTVTTMSTTILSGVPYFKGRLRVMEEQIREGLAKGFLSTGQAQALLAEHERVARIESTLPKFELDRAQSDMVETKLNALNIAIHQSMEAHMHLAGAGVIQ